MIKAIVGANWGDEGKGKITDTLAKESDIVVRFQGGSNAGHTIKNEYGKFPLHMLPSGVFYSHVTCVLGDGVALNIPKLLEEIKGIVDKGVPQPKLLVSDRAHIVMPYHILLDTYEEARLAGKSFGSTKAGIAPCYSDKYAKIGFQVNELFMDEKALRERIENVCTLKNTLIKHLYHQPELVPDEIYNTMMEYKEMIKPYVANTDAFLHKAVADGKNILLEGQLGAMKDIDHGIYPMVTSSNTIAAYGAAGAGIPPYAINEVIAVTKAYSSSVGAGAFVSEIFGDEAEELRKRGGDGGEYGATTGRPRRVGWYDCVASRYGCKVQGATQVALTVLDPLGYLDEIPMCVGYDIDGEEHQDFPNTTYLYRAKPILKKMPGWKSDITGIRKFEDLPQACQDYVNEIERQIQCPITMVSNGPAREDIIPRKPLI
ncbi:adenylosuccinate synthase [Aminicella lysinilytica]|uniref:Adenylosuccinate synthetase n=1 Tax=Aminicella lysinilytica TaxID=433323 RepID=A0A4R6Q055_9FIRM|nr:adenylosuccinate synthase [Aminicella lysinilytica]NLD10864.1 adenylosuccinate synthase [Clostridiales bacterium]TDP51842.1 adenylosuccinate synthetase [Aminicella lysinilytica]